jgi:hypothetical protein
MDVRRRDRWCACVRNPLWLISQGRTFHWPQPLLHCLPVRQRSQGWHLSWMQLQLWNPIELLWPTGRAPLQVPFADLRVRSSKFTCPHFLTSSYSVTTWAKAVDRLALALALAWPRDLYRLHDRVDTKLCKRDRKQRQKKPHNILSISTLKVLIK